ncbi:MAG: hypothetical protein AB1792_06200 [Candidatus Zixiibacteriota bacterium]
MTVRNGVLKAIESAGHWVRAFVGRDKKWECPGRDQNGRPFPCGRKSQRVVRNIPDTGLLELQWERVETSPTAYELRAAGEVVAFLCGEVDLASICCVRTASGDWGIAFEREGPRANHVVARTAETGTEAAWLVKRPLRGCLLSLSDDRDYHWTMVRWVPPLWSLTSADGSSLLTLSADVLSTRERGSVALAPEAIDLPDVSLLSVLALYIFLLCTHRSAEWAT